MRVRSLERPVSHCEQGLGDRWRRRARSWIPDDILRERIDDTNRHIEETNRRLERVETRVGDIGRDIGELRDRTGKLEGTVSTFIRNQGTVEAA